MNKIKVATFRVPVKFRDSIIERLKWRLFYLFYKKQIQVILDEMNGELRNIYWNKRANEYKGETWTR
jgi:hypothetical protein